MDQQQQQQQQWQNYQLSQMTAQPAARQVAGAQGMARHRTNVHFRPALHWRTCCEAAQDTTHERTRHT
jgi:hypothetical protein